MEALLQSASGSRRMRIVLRRRRIAFALLVLTSSIGLLSLMAATLFPAGIDLSGTAMLFLFALTLPWTVVGFWNAVIGFALMSFARDPAGLVAPHLRSISGREEVESTPRRARLVDEVEAHPSQVVRDALLGLVAEDGHRHDRTARGPPA